MTNLREQMRGVIQDGINGWLDACFGGDKAPLDSITGYPLTRETSRIYYHASYSYTTLENTFLEGMGDVCELNANDLQRWVNYHWNFARVELSEDFSGFKGYPVTEDMELRRRSFRETLYMQGYRKVTNESL